MINEELNQQGDAARDFETKHLGNDNIAGAFDDFMHAFEAFKDTNDTRLDRLEKRMALDVLTDEKLSRIGKALDEHKRIVDELVHKTARPAIGGGLARAGVNLQHKAAFHGYMRKGDMSALHELEAKSLTVGSDPDGGYLVPDETEAMINRALRDVSPIRAIAGIRQVSSSVYKKPFAAESAAAGWVGEREARPETNSPKLTELAFPTMELYAMPSATQSLLDDSAIDIDQWITDEVRAAFAEQEGAAFINGNGANQPRGFLTYPAINNDDWTWGNIGTLTTGVPGVFPETNPSDILIDLICKSLD